MTSPTNSTHTYDFGIAKEDPSLERSWEFFKEETRDHKLTILHDNGVYRHLRVAQPGTAIFSWDIITWPGHLAIAGDIGDGFTFARLHDMFNFFTPYASDAEAMPQINPDYWREKLGHAQRGVEKKYSPHSFMHQIRQSAEEYAHDYEDLHNHPHPTFSVEEFCSSAVYYAEDEHSARDWASRESSIEVLGQDLYWEGDFSVFDHHFITACFAISDAIRRYRNAKESDAVIAENTDAAQ